MKEEMRATRKAFRDVVRRAREEQRDKRRARKSRRRFAQARSEEDKARKTALDEHMENLSLDGPNLRPPARSQTMPIARTTLAQRPVRSETSSEMSVPGVIHTPSSALQASAPNPPAEAPDKKAKLRGLLKSRDAKKQQKSSGPEKGPAGTQGETSKKPSKKDPGTS